MSIEDDGSEEVEGEEADDPMLLGRPKPQDLRHEPGWPTTLLTAAADDAAADCAARWSCRRLRSRRARSCQYERPRSPPRARLPSTRFAQQPDPLPPTGEPPRPLSQGEPLERMLGQALQQQLMCPEPLPPPREPPQPEPLQPVQLPEPLRHSLTGSLRLQEASLTRRKPSGNMSGRERIGTCAGGGQLATT